MNMLKEVIRAATNRTTSLSDVLRQCLVLAYDLDNDALKAWLDHEMNGYPSGDDVPDYRKINITAKGLFLGGFGASINDQPLPPSVLLPAHRHWAERAYLMQPIGSYEEFTRESGKQEASARINWPADLTAHYQTKFIEHYALNRAWQEIPTSVFFALVDVVRNRALKFALEIQKELGSKNDDLASLPKERVNQMVTNYIFGGNVVVATNAENFSQTSIAAGDKQGLAVALGHLGVSEVGIGELIEATTQDSLSAPQATTLGQRTLGAVEKIATSGLKVGGEIAKTVLIDTIKQYLGLPPA